MAQFILTYRNILETGTVTSTDESTSFPLYRTYDRDIGKLFKFNSHGANLWIKVNQTPTIYAVDRLIIPAGHTLNGLNCKLQYSTTGAYGGEEVNALSWAQADALIINKTFSTQTKQYWRFLITSDPAAAPELPELYLTSSYSLVQNPSPGASEGYQNNVLREEALSGRVRRVKFGEPRKIRNYHLPYLTTADKNEWETWETIWQGVKFFYIIDPDSTLIYVEMLNDPTFTRETSDLWSMDLQLLEVL